MFKDFSDAQLLKEVDAVRDWSRVVGFQGRAEEANYASYRDALVAEFHARGYLYPAWRVDIQPANLKPLVVA